MGTNGPAHYYERFWISLRQECEKLSSETAGVAIQTGQPIDGGALSVSIRVTKPGHGFPLGKIILTPGPHGGHVLVVEEFSWASDADPFTKNEKKLEMRFDTTAQRFFIHVRDGVEIHEQEAPQYVLGRAKEIFQELMKARNEARRI